jgi:hypothetical protein
MSDQTTDNTQEIVLDTNRIVLGPSFGNVMLTAPENIVLQVPGVSRVPNNTPTITLASADNIFVKPIVLDPPAVLSAEDPAP